MLRRLLDPKSDFAFKKVFGTEKNRDILIKFLNDMLDFRDKEPIVEIILQQTILDAQTPSLKSGVLDILCKDACGNSYIIETLAVNNPSHLPTSHPWLNIKSQSRDDTLQAQGNQDDFGKRAEFYASKAYFNQLRIGEDYKTLKQVFF